MKWILQGMATKYHARTMRAADKVSGLNLKNILRGAVGTDEMGSLIILLRVWVCGGGKDVICVGGPDGCTWKLGLIE